MTYAVASDYSEVIETPDGFGRFPSKEAALRHQIGLLEGEADRTKTVLRRARRQLRYELKRIDRNHKPNCASERTRFVTPRQACDCQERLS